MSSIAKTYKIPPKEFEKQYKNKLSEYRKWSKKEGDKDYILFPNNIGEQLSIDETSVSKGELYTILTNKQAHGQNGALVAICEGTKADKIINILAEIPIESRNKVKEVTLDMSTSMDRIVRSSFVGSQRVVDRFHVQKLVSQAVQEIRIGIRKKVIMSENEAHKKSQEEGKTYVADIYENGDSKKQLLARSRYLLFKSKSKWTDRQKERAIILFKNYPELENAYKLSMMFRSFYESSKTIETGKQKLEKWYERVESEIKNGKAYLEPFKIVADTIRLREKNILKYFMNRNTNASAESFNAKLKGFRSLVRGVTDKKFFLFRLSKLYG